MTLSGPVPLSVVILTYNEEKNLSPCLESVTGWTEEVFVVDSGSSDKTKEIALREGASVVEHPFETHAKQWQWALEHLPVATDWILGLDADQSVSSGLKQEIIQLFNGGENSLEGIEGIYLNRKQIFRGQWIRYGGYYPKYLLKLFRKDKVQTDIRDLVDHHFYISGKTLKLQGDFIEENLKENDLNFWIKKHRSYASLYAAEELYRRQNGRRPISPSFFGTPDQRTLWLKALWCRLPLFVRPFLYFFYRYFLKLGFLDGKEGLVFHFLHGFWYRLMIDLRLSELRRKT